MSIDPRIPMLGQPIQLNSPLNMLARVQGVQNMRQTNALNAMQMQDAQAQRAAQQQQAQAMERARAEFPDPPEDAPPQLKMAVRAFKLGLGPFSGVIEAMKPDEYMSAAPGSAVINRRTGQSTMTVPQPAPKVDFNKPFLPGPDGEGIPNLPYQAYERSLKAKPKSSGGAVPAANATVQPPKLKQGERWNPVEERVEVVPGSALYQQQSSAHAKDDAALRGVETKMDTAIKKIQGLLDPKNKDAFDSNFGGYNAYVSQYLPGATADARKTIESIKSDLKAAGLEMMRSGGSIGQMTQQEWPIVERMIATIDPVLGEEKARDEFGKIVVYMEAIKSNARKVYETEWGGTQFAKKAAAQDGANPTAPPGGQDIRSQADAILRGGK